MVRSIVIPHNAALGPFLAEVAELGDFQYLVDGWLEPLELPALGVTVYLSESARREHRPLNCRATAFWWLYSADPASYPLILGDVVLTGAGGDIPEPVIEQVFSRDEFVLQVHPRDCDAWYDTYGRFSNIFDAAVWCLLLEATMLQGAEFRVGGESPIDFTADRLAAGGEQSW
jgi:hypothetical protein